MNETARFQKLFEDLFDGQPWLEVTIAGTLRGLNAQQAARKPHADWNSIWEITNHLIHWRENVLERVKGEILTTPNDNYFRALTDTSDDAWLKTLARLESSQKNWLGFLEQLKPEDLENEYPPNRMSYADHIHGILQHDAYHLGQIVMLAKHALKQNHI